MKALREGSGHRKECDTLRKELLQLPGSRGPRFHLWQPITVQASRPLHDSLFFFLPENLFSPLPLKCHLQLSYTWLSHSSHSSGTINGAFVQPMLFLSESQWLLPGPSHHILLNARHLHVRSWVVFCVLIFALCNDDQHTVWMWKLFFLKNLEHCSRHLVLYFCQHLLL